MKDWLPIETAPRDGKPIILWLEDRDAPPAFPVTAGFWFVDDMTGATHWQVLTTAGHTHCYFDEHVKGWKPFPAAWPTALPPGSAGASAGSP
jgi:hypothetical protein